MMNEKDELLFCGMAGLTRKEYLWHHAIFKGYDYDRGATDEEYKNAFMKRRRFKILFYQFLYGVDPDEIVNKWHNLLEYVKDLRK